MFGARLLRGAGLPGRQPTVDALRGRVLPLLSGDGTAAAASTSATSATTRPSRSTAAARSSRCTTPAAARSGTGPGPTAPTAASPGCGTGSTTAARRPPSRSTTTATSSRCTSRRAPRTLWSHVGKLGADGEITWQASHQYDNGVLPTVAFTDGTHLREIHQSQSSSQNWTWNGTLSAHDGRVDRQRQDVRRAVRQGHRHRRRPAREGVDRRRRPDAVEHPARGHRPRHRRPDPLPAGGVRRVPGG